MPQYSDRAGRKPVFGIVIFGGLCSDIIFIITTLRASRMPGGYNLFILGAAIQGKSTQLWIEYFLEPNKDFAR